MKYIKQIFLILLLSISFNATVTAQYLNAMPVAKRDSLLIAIAKEVVLKYGPDYYREYSKPIIERQTVPQKGETNPSGVNAGRIIYRITFLYDKTEEVLQFDYAAKVSIWADTSHPANVFFGNGHVRGIQEGTDWRNDTTIEPVPYQAAAIAPLYNLTDKDSTEPLNKTELLQKGYVRRSDGQWVKTTPDVPPHKRNR